MRIFTLFIFVAFTLACTQPKARVNTPPPTLTVWKSMVMQGEICRMIAQYNINNPDKPLSDCGCTDTLTFDHAKVQIILDAIQERKAKETTHNEKNI